jgi:hypothetical protein
MKFAWLGCLLVGGLLFGGTQDSEFNVNTRYTVENVLVSADGRTTDVGAGGAGDERISSRLRKDIAALIGEKFNPSVLEEMAGRLRKEFHARTVEQRVLRGKSPEYVQVVFEVKLRPARFDVSVPKFLYHGEQGFSGAVEGTAMVRQNGFTLGLVSDGDELVERYSGIAARYENTALGTDRVRLRFAFETYHELWNSSTADALATPTVGAATPQETPLPLYRARQNVEPEVTFVLARPLTFTVGASFERLQPENPAAQTESANAVITTLRYRRRLEDSDNQHDLEADYSLRAATRLLGTDFVYSRHRWEFRYMLTRGKSVVIEDFSGGMILGRAPLFERFVLGNGSTLRGWNKYELDPLGGNRMVHNSVEYRYGIFQVFYDSGAIWDDGESAVLRHSAGLGLRKGVVSLALAFPLREGRIDPMLMVGMNY